MITEMGFYVDVMMILGKERELDAEDRHHMELWVSCSYICARRKELD